MIAAGWAIAAIAVIFPVQQASAAPAARPQVVYPDRTDASGPLRDMPVLPDQAGRKYLPRKDIANRLGTPAPVAALDPALSEVTGAATGSTLLNFDGVNNRNGVLPPDTNGDIGPNHYVQWVNLSLQVWAIDRANNTATSVYGPVNGNTIWSGFGGPCATSNSGDPIVLYDRAADRWMISQFALPNYPSGPFYQCIAVSQSPDPTGSWYRYQFTVSQNKMNDYPHFGVWRDGYYASFNQFNAGSMTWGGQGAAVFERDKMLQGGVARMVYFDLYPVDPNLGGMLPADLDGPTPPPSNAPNIYAAFDDDAWGYSPDQLQYWNFHVDWTTPTNSTFTKGAALNTAAFDYNLCGGARNCVPQPGTSAKLDTVSDRLMYRLQYRNFGTYETLVANHSVDVDGTDRAGVRWYELRRPAGGAWGIQQQGTFSPDGTDRWMGSVAMNGAGQMALGYSVSSGSIYPSIRYTGRMAGDPSGAMTQGENTIIDGSGSQTSTAYRWGDYSSMSVDPVDDCTFWYTTEYVQLTGGANWRTRIASFRLPGCVAGDTPPSVSITNPAAGSTVRDSVTLTATANDDNGVDQVTFAVDGTAIDTDTNGSDGWSATWNSATVGDGSHTLTATATDTVGQNGSDSHAVTVNNVPDPVLHIGDLDGARTPGKANWKATVTVTVHDAAPAHALVSGAVVSFAWSGGSTGTGTCTTGTDGKCSATVNVKNSKASVTFTVRDVAASGATYDAGANHDPDSDSNGTAITVYR